MRYSNYIKAGNYSHIYDAILRFALEKSKNITNVGRSAQLQCTMDSDKFKQWLLDNGNRNWYANLNVLMRF